MHTAFCIFQDGCSLTLPRRGPLPRHHDVRCPPFSMTSRARFRWLLPSASRARRCVRFNQTTARRNLAIKATRSSRRVPSGHVTVAGVLQTGNPGWKSVMSSNFGCPLAAHCHPGLCEKSRRSPLAISHRHGFIQPWRST